ncbi:transcriptional repressor LexA [Patescibacteria group bacterium]
MLSADQKRIEQLQKYYRHRRRLPSYAEMLKLFDLKSKNSIYKIVQRLNKFGYLKRDTEDKIIPGSKFFKMAVRGTVEAGFPSPAEEELTDVITLDEYLITNRNASFIVKVSGDSMIEAGINQGDLVIVERGRQPINGDIVVAQVDDEWTLKRYEKQGQQITLYPANKKYKPIKPQAELQIDGVVVGQVRKYK